MTRTPSDFDGGEKVKLSCRLSSVDDCVTFETVVTTTTDELAVLKHPFLDDNRAFRVYDDGTVYVDRSYYASCAELTLHPTED